jgi:hypothetical protein
METEPFGGFAAKALNAILVYESGQGNGDALDKGFFVL